MKVIYIFPCKKEQKRAIIFVLLRQRKMIDKLHDNCAIFGVFDTKKQTTVSPYIPLGLHALQHRGQEASGAISTDGCTFYMHKDKGLASTVFKNIKLEQELQGFAAIGHNRYSTSGGHGIENIQPIYANLAIGGVAIAHNGNLANTNTLRKEMINKGRIFHSTSDTEIFLHLIAEESGSLQERIVKALRHTIGGYALLILSHDRLIAIKDIHGIRPMVLGSLGDLFILASETVGLDILGASFIRELNPGEMLIIDENGLHSMFPFPKKKQYACAFESVYFSRPDSYINNISYYEIRTKMGRALAQEFPVDADLVVPVPDSSVAHALGFAQESRIPLGMGIIRNHYIGRTFIQPTDEIRHLNVRLKHNVNSKIISGKRVVLVDDSIVRGTTCRKIIDILYAAGATEIHLRIASPPVKHPCFYGIDTPDHTQLMAHIMSEKEMTTILKVHSIQFLPLKRLHDILQHLSGICDACFSGNYPTLLVDKEIPSSHTSFLKEK